MKAAIKDQGTFVYAISALATGDISALLSNERFGHAEHCTLATYLWRMCEDLEQLGVAQQTCSGLFSISHPALGAVQWARSLSGPLGIRNFHVWLDGAPLLVANASDDQSFVITSWLASTAPWLTDSQAINILGHI